MSEEKTPSDQTVRQNGKIALGNKRGKDLSIKFSVALERSVQKANLVNREPAGRADFGFVERQFAAEMFRCPPVQSKSSPRRDVLPNFPHRPHPQADFFHRLARHRRLLALPRLNFAADRRPVASTADARRPLNEQNLVPSYDHGDDGIKHKINRLRSARPGHSSQSLGDSDEASHFLDVLFMTRRFVGFGFGIDAEWVNP